MLSAIETTFTFFVIYLSPLMSVVFWFWMKKRTSRQIACKRDNSHFLYYVLTPLMSEVYLLVNLFQSYILRLQCQ